MKKLFIIDLFAGIGGIRLGFEQVFGDIAKTVFVSEIDEQAQKTYKTNFKDSFNIAGDITKIGEADVPSFDVCLAGFPCQTFSIAGQRKGFIDDYKGVTRGMLFFDVARICALHKPKVIFIENVKGLLNHDKGYTYHIIKSTLEEIGYNVCDKVLNSVNYGLPQNRERIYVVAFRRDIDISTFCFPGHIDSTRRIKDIIEGFPVPIKYYISDRYMDALYRHRARNELKGNGFGYKIRDKDDVAGAIICGGMGHERNLFIDKGGIRKLTPREWARLQGYPENFQLLLADTHIYKQLGNSVSVSVIKAIAEKIKIMLDGCEL